MANNCCYDLLAKGSEYGIKKLYSFLKQIGTPESKFHRVWDFFPYDDWVKIHVHSLCTYLSFMV